MRDGSTSMPSTAAPCIGGGERLRATHAAQPGSDDEAPCERAAEVARRHGAKRLVRALHDALRADVDPRAGGHLAVHREAQALESPELIPVGPASHEIGIGDAARAAHRACVRNTATGLPLCTSSVSSSASVRSVRTMASNASHERAARPVPPYTTRSSGRSATSAIEVVHQHAQRGFLLPPRQRALAPRGARTGRGPLRGPERRLILRFETCVMTALPP